MGLCPGGSEPPFARKGTPHVAEPMMQDPDHQRRPPPGREWYQSAVIYELDVKNFQDSDGDGCGDFPGLISRLDYVRDLGVDCVWVQPFYPSPGRDNGYDVADYRGVDPRLGTLTDFDRFVAAA